MSSLFFFPFLPVFVFNLLQIISKEIPANIIYEDDRCLAFRDISPQAPVHFLVIPKARDGLTRLSKAHEGQKDILGHLLYTAQKVAKDGTFLARPFTYRPLQRVTTRSTDFFHEEF